MSDEKGEKEFSLTKGSTYRVRSLNEKDNALITEGVYEGPASVVNVFSLVIRMKDGDREFRRIIPAHMILSLDVIDQIDAEEKKDKESTDKYFM